MFFTLQNKRIYERNSICNDNTLIALPSNALEFLTVYETEDQGFTFQIVHKTLFYLANLFSYRLFKKAHIFQYVCFSSGLKRNILTKL